MPLKGVMNDPIINPRRACVTSVTVVVLYVCVCVFVSVFSVLPFRAIRHPTRGITGYSVENENAVFSKLLSSKVRSVINLTQVHD